VTEPESKPRETLEEQVVLTHRKAVLIVVALTLSVLLQFGLALLILQRGTTSTPSDLRVPLYGVAAFLAIAAIAVRRVMLLRPRLSGVAEKRGPLGVLRHLFSVTLICAALGEMVFLMGFMMTFFGGDQTDLIRMLVVAAVIVLTSYPRLTTWKQAVAYYSAVRQEV
jgi:hypothetical protein